MARPAPCDHDEGSDGAAQLSTHRLGRQKRQLALPEWILGPAGGHVHFQEV